MRDDALLVVTFISDDPWYEDSGAPAQWYDAVREGSMLLAILALTCCAFALVQLVLAVQVRARVPSLSVLDGAAQMHAPAPKLSIIVPARDEAAALDAALQSKLACRYPNIEVVVVDDRSTDGTSAIAAGLARDDARLEVTRIEELPPGWLGKVHALSVGVDRAHGEWILLSDADVHVHPSTLDRVIAYARAHDVDLVAAMPRMDRVSFVLDAAVASMMRLIALAGRVWQANDDRSSTAIGVGAFMVVRRSVLTESNALATVSMDVADDVALATALKSAGARCRLFAARDRVHLTFAPRLAALVRGLEKGGGLFGFSLLRTVIATGGWFAADLGIPLLALTHGGWVAMVGGAHLVLSTITHVVIARHFDAPLRGALAWPLGVSLGIAMLFRAGALAWWRQAIVWRGTRYSRSEIEAGRRFSVNPLRRIAPHD